MSDVVVHGWHAEGAGVVVETDRGRFRADRLVITPGPWAADLLRLPGMPFVVVRKSLFWFQPISARATDFASGHFPCFAFDTAAGFYYGFPALDGRGVKIAEHTGGLPVTDPLGVDRTLDRAEAARVSAVAGERLPGLMSPPVAHAVCMYTMTPDAHFCLGHHPDFPQVAIAAGLSGHGYKFASVIGDILADLVLDGRTTRPIGFLAPDRFAGRGA
jgi:glycine/D-amino acid oxidase-like deaminating enzyme